MLPHHLSTFFFKFKCKICVQKEVIHNFKNHILVTWPATKLLILRKWWGLRNQSLLFCLRYDPLITFRRQNHITLIFIKTMSHDLLVQMAYWSGDWSRVVEDHPLSHLTTHVKYSGRKNVLRKLLRIPYRRFKAVIFCDVLCLFVAGVLSEKMHEVRTFAPCKAFLFDMFAVFFVAWKLLWIQNNQR